MSLAGGFNAGVRVDRHPVCLLCGSAGSPLYAALEDRSFHAPGSWALLRCPVDGLVWLNPQPVADETGKLYPGYCTHTLPPLARPRQARLRGLVRQGILSGAFGYEEMPAYPLFRALACISSQIGPLREAVGGMVIWLRASWRGRLLDVGSGNGSLAARLRDLGWNVTCIEPDPIPARLAREEFGLSVHEGTLEDARFPDSSFDAVTMHHVIEHLPDPIGTLRECRRVIRPGGKLVIVTPNVQSLGSRAFGSAWSYLDPPRHLTLFSSQTLVASAAQAGFQVEHMRSSPRHAHLVWTDSHSIARRGVQPRGAIRQLLRKAGAAAFWCLEWFLTGVDRGAGEELVLVAAWRAPV